ncbi:MAG: hypothetical protein ACYS5V_02850 [Planctomycetota bacterium]|jgi:hypothetical protein
MTKRELIDQITHLNASATPAFLAEFEASELGAYLQRLQRVALHRPTSDSARPASDKPADQKELQPALF